MVVKIIKKKVLLPYTCTDGRERHFRPFAPEQEEMRRTALREMLYDIFTVFLAKDAWRVWVGLIALWFVVCLFAKVR